jgi:hypothetical protein
MFTTCDDVYLLCTCCTVAVPCCTVLSVLTLCNRKTVRSVALCLMPGPRSWTLTLALTAASLTGHRGIFTSLRSCHSKSTGLAPITLPPNYTYTSIRSVLKQPRCTHHHGNAASLAPDARYVHHSSLPCLGPACLVATWSLVTYAPVPDLYLKPHTCTSAPVPMSILALPMPMPVPRSGQCSATSVCMIVRSTLLFLHLTSMHPTQWLSFMPVQWNSS